MRSPIKFDDSSVIGAVESLTLPSIEPSSEGVNDDTPPTSRSFGRYGIGSSPCQKIAWPRIDVSIFAYACTSAP
jgi:hypothetical protein